MSFYIAGTGSALPDRAVTNDDLGKMVETSDEWIKTRTGIRERRVLTSETLTDLSEAAGSRALAAAGLDAKDIDLVICATLRGDAVTPAQSCLTAERLGIVAPCFDVNAACSAMLYSFSIADSFIQTGKAQNVLILTCEAMSKQLDWTDRTTCVLFGDGAAAVVLRRGYGLLSMNIECVPNSKNIYTPSFDGYSPFNVLPQRKVALNMDGQETYKFAVNEMVSQIQLALSCASLTPEDITYVLPHQANIRIIDAATRRCGLGAQKVLTNIASYGNMSATSIAVLLDENARAGKFNSGDRLLMVAFGAGMTAASAIVQWK